jgi:hypothetical protein
MRDFSEAVGDEFTDDYGYSSDSDLEQDWDFESPDPVEIPTKNGPRTKKTPQGQYNESALAGKVIKVQDVAFIT